jgi:hypothetical protein
MRNYEILSLVLSKKTYTQSKEGFDFSFYDKGDTRIPIRVLNKQINFTLKSIESLSSELDVLCKFQNDKTDFYFSLENNENKPNIFIRIWKKFVEIVSKIFFAVVNFFKLIINKIIQFIKWVINKIFRKVKSKEEIKSKLELFDELKDKPLFTSDNSKGNEDYDDSKSAPKLNASQKHLINICHLNADVITKIKRLTDYSKAFVYSATKIMNDDIKHGHVFMVTIDNNNGFSSINNYHEKLKGDSLNLGDNSYLRILPVEAEYFGSLNNMAGIKFMSENNLKSLTRFTKTGFFDTVDTNLPIFSRGGKVLTECIIANRNGIKTFNDLKKQHINFDKITLGQICSKEFFYKMISLSEDIKKTYINENKEVQNLCKSMMETSKKYYTMVKEAEKEFDKIDFTNEGKGYVKMCKATISAMKKRTLNSKTLITTVAQITRYSFSIRCLLLSISQLVEKVLDQKEKDQLKKMGKTNTLYGNITIGLINPKSDHLPDKFKSELETLTKNYINTLMSQNKFHQNVMFRGFVYKKDLDQICAIVTDDTNRKKTGYKCHMEISNNLKPYAKQCSLMLKANIPYEVCIAGTIIHEATHILQLSHINKKDNTYYRNGALADSSTVKYNSNYGKRVTHDYNDKKMTKKDKQNIADDTSYYSTLLEKNANNAAYTFISHIINSFNISKAKKSYMLKVTKKGFVHRS